MCAECRTIPCDALCPNAEPLEPLPGPSCVLCEENGALAEIYEGERYLRVGVACVHESCLIDHINEDPGEAFEFLGFPVRTWKGD